MIFVAAGLAEGLRTTAFLRFSGAFALVAGTGSSAGAPFDAGVADGAALAGGEGCTSSRLGAATCAFGCSRNCAPINAIAEARAWANGCGSESER